MSARFTLIGWLALVLLALNACSDEPKKNTDAGAAGNGAGTGGSTLDAAAMRDAALTDARTNDDDAGASAADGGSLSDAQVTSSGDAGNFACRDGLRDGDETDIDCGGPDCGTCLSGRKCEKGADCLSGECEGGKCTCVPLVACPDNACGHVVHCGGELDCGSCASGVCYENQCCSPRACKEGECGVISDGCGGTLRCGDESCCTPRSCEHPSLANRCGDYDDRCGGSVTCGCSGASDKCYLGECCVPKTCDALAACGSILSDGCGGTVTCGCPSGEICKSGACCKPLTDCSTWAGPGCGKLQDGCGGSLDCGCSGGESCVAGSCCTPLGCGAGNAGDACGPSVSNGCGGTQSCGCAGGLPCYQGQCCQPQTCSQLGRDDRCGPAANGCGVSNLWCGCGTVNGMRVAQRNHCGEACADTLAKLNTCNASAATETLEQQSGWDFTGSFNTSLCTASYGFSPNWTSCHNGFQLDAQGFIYLTAGTHCFSITGNGTNSCGALYFVSDPASFTGWDNLPTSTAATVVTGAAAACFTLASTDYYPIRWHYTLDGILGDLHVNHCPGGSGNCAPVSSALLYPALP